MVGVTHGSVPSFLSFPSERSEISRRGIVDQNAHEEQSRRHTSSLRGAWDVAELAKGVFSDSAISLFAVWSFPNTGIWGLFLIQ